MIKAKVFVDEEFQKQMSDKRETCSPADLQRLEEDSFDYWDTNHDGNISLQELKKGLQGAFQMQVTDHDAKELMYIFDENGDGLLQKEEFADLKEFRCKLVVMAHKERRKANVDPKEDGDKAGATSWTDRLVSALSHAFNS